MSLCAPFRGFLHIPGFEGLSLHLRASATARGRKLLHRKNASSSAINERKQCSFKVLRERSRYPKRVLRRWGWIGQMQELNT